MMTTGAETVRAELRLLGSSVVIEADDSELLAGLVSIYRHIPRSVDGVPLRVRLRSDGEQIAELSIEGEGVVRGRGASRREAGAATAFALFHSVARRAVQQVVFHAAAVETAAGVILLVAPSRLGKTTLSVRLALRGAGFLSDEAAPIGRTDGRLSPFPRSVGVRPGPLLEALAGRRRDELGLRVAERGGRPKLLVDLSGLVQFGCGGTVRHVVFLVPDFTVRAADEPIRCLLDLDRRTPSLMRELLRIPGVVEVAEQGSDVEPSLRVVMAPTTRLSAHLDRLCPTVGCHLVRMVELGDACDWGANPEIEEVAGRDGVLLASRHLLNGSRSALLERELGGSAAALVMEVATALGAARFWRLSAGTLDTMCERIESLS